MKTATLEKGVRALRRAFPGAAPVCGLVLGSGWSRAAEVFRIRRSIGFASVPALGAAAVKGHRGRISWADLHGVETLIFEGRRHWYEGAGWEPIAFPIFALKRLGAAIVVLTNAAGSLRTALKPGDLILLRDHINAVGVNPLAGPHDPFWGPRFPDMTEVYDADLRRLVRTAAAAAGVKIRAGIYAWTSGPAYETPAESRALRKAGADAVGSSTAPEAVLAHAAGLRVIGVSCITNMAAGFGRSPLSHDRVAALAEAAQPEIGRLFREVWRRLSEGRP